MNNSKYDTLVINLTTYLEVLIENYRCRGEKIPESLKELYKFIVNLRYVDLEEMQEKVEKIADVKYTIGSGISLLKTTDINPKELSTLRDSVSKDWNSFLNEEQKDIKDLLTLIDKAFEKASKKESDLLRDRISVDEKNIKGMQGIKNQETSGKLPYYFDLYANVFTTTIEYSPTRGNINTREQITFSEGLKKVLDYVKVSLRSYYSGNLELEEIKIEVVETDEQEILDEYHQMLGEGKIEKVSKEKPLTFFAKIGFQPLKKQLNEREIIDELAKTNYIIDILDETIRVIMSNQATKIFPQTLEKLEELRKKYNAAYKQLNEDLKNSNYEEMKNAVENQKKIERKEEIHRLKRKKCLLLYDEILRTSDEELRKKYLNEIKEIDLDEKEKEEIKHSVEHAYRIEIATKEMEEKIISDGQKQDHNYESAVTNNIRRQAVKELDIEGAFESEYNEAGLDVKDDMTTGRKEELIQRKIQELKSNDYIIKQNQALQQLKDEGNIRKEATLSTLILAERQALEAQMRINDRALEEQSSGRSR